jgi:hypothetical protein
MREYPKIQSLFKRDEKTHKVLIGEYTLPEFSYLSKNEWRWMEKIDGTRYGMVKRLPSVGELITHRCRPSYSLDCKIFF